jgi:PHD/YefM family antitoxin component YafN of YafNO toxin-antitoxin module
MSRRHPLTGHCAAAPEDGVVAVSVEPAAREVQMMKAIEEQYIVDSKGKKTAVIVAVERFERLLEDLHDLAVVAERRREKPISLSEMKRRLKRDGLL